MACANYWANKLREEGRAQSLLETMVEFDEECVRWVKIEIELGLIRDFGYMGRWQEHRKALSHDGTPDGIDLGNWTYAVCIRTMLTDFRNSDVRRRGTEQLNDESAGDIMEAIWGLHFHRTWNCQLMGRVSEESLSTADLSAYCESMSSVVKLFDRFHTDFLVPPEWPDSRKMAAMLV